MTKPPLARLLLRLIPPPHREFIEGDLEEEFAARASRGRTRAAAWYWRQVLATLPWFVEGALERLHAALTAPDLYRRILAMAVPLGPTPAPRRPAFGSHLIASKPTRQNGAFTTGLMSMVFHVATLGALVYSTVGQGPVDVPDEVQIIQVDALYQEAEPTPPPVESAEPVEVDLLSMIPPDHIPIDIPPPGRVRIDPDSLYQDLLRESQDTTDDAGSEIVGMGEDPPFTPFEVGPTMRNRDEVGRALQREYPALLRDAGVGGRVEVWIHLDAEGKVGEVHLNETSGQPSLDEAALRVAQIIEFTPALNRDKPVPVWVSIPITFQVN